MKKIAQKLHNHRLKLTILLVMSVLYFFSYFQRVAIPGTIFDDLQTTFSTSAARIALLGAITFYLYASMQIFTGIIADRFGAIRVLLTGSVIMALGSILFPLATSLSILYAARVLVSFGASLVFISIIKEIDNLFDEKNFTIFMALFLGLGYSGGLIGTLPFERAVNAFGWRQSLLGIGIACAVVVLFSAAIFHKIKQPGKRKQHFSWSTLKGILLNKSAMPLMFSASITFAIYFLFQTVIGKKVLQDCYGFSSATAASYTFAMMLTTIFVVSCSGIISRLIGNRRRPIMIGATAVMLTNTILILLILLGIVNKCLILPAYIALAAASSFSPIFNAVMKELNHPESAGTSIGLINGFCYGVVAIIINLAGYTMDLFKSQAIITETAIRYPVKAYITITIGCLVLAALSFLSSFLTKETFGNNIYKKIN